MFVIQIRLDKTGFNLAFLNLHTEYFLFHGCILNKVYIKILAFIPSITSFQKKKIYDIPPMN